MQLPSRQQSIESLFSGTVPLLWCPPLTHYDSSGLIDAARMAAHLRHLSPYARGWLIPGSTGDGWELTTTERRQVLSIGIEQAQKLNSYVLIGALHPNLAQSKKLILEDLEWLKARANEKDPLKAMTLSRVCGFTICPPRGQHLTQEQIRDDLARVLSLQLPVAIYQLPQVTQNEVIPEVVANLAQHYPNFIFFKDTSGSDKVALSGADLFGVFVARGAEGAYSRWLKTAGGPYDGFLLSSANCFARELLEMSSLLSTGRMEEAGQLSRRIESVIVEVFRLAGEVRYGNPFANGNKAIDHFFAHGPDAGSVLPPRLHAGELLPPELIKSAGQILRREGLMPAKGYLSDLGAG